METAEFGWQKVQLSALSCQLFSKCSIACAGCGKWLSFFVMKLDIDNMWAGLWHWMMTNVFADDSGKQKFVTHLCSPTLSSSSNWRAKNAGLLSLWWVGYWSFAQSAMSQWTNTWYSGVFLYWSPTERRLRCHGHTNAPFLFPVQWTSNRLYGFLVIFGILLPLVILKAGGAKAGISASTSSCQTIRLMNNKNQEDAEFIFDAHPILQSESDKSSLMAWCFWFLTNSKQFFVSCSHGRRTQAWTAFQLLVGKNSHFRHLWLTQLIFFGATTWARRQALNTSHVLRKIQTAYTVRLRS